ncbi:MAG: DUF4012 domain-containing protein, partial [Actinomycetota bacterium]
MGRARLLRTARPERRPNRRRRAIIAAALLVLVGLGVATAVSVATALSIRRHLEQGRSLLTTAQSALLAGDADRAETDFVRARQVFREAEGERGALLLRIGGLVPFLGRTPDALISLNRIGDKIAGAGADVARGIGRLPEGLSSLGLHEGGIPLDALRTLAPSVRRALGALDTAAEEAAELPDSWVISQVAEAGDLVRERLAQAVPLARSADALLSSLPRFAGQGREARYFVAAQNSAELRGTGGLIGNYAILTLQDGRMSLSPFSDVQTLPNLPVDRAPTPSREFAELYGPFGGGGFWLNLNMTPDAPTAATVIEQLYEEVKGEQLDGTIFFDLQGLADLLGATGPVEVKRLEYTFTPDNIVEYVATAGYLKSRVRNPFKEGPRLVAQAVWTAFLSATDPEKALRALVEAAAHGHLILHGADPQLQTAFRLAGVAGDFGARSGDFFGVAHSNAAANKVDFFLRQELTYDVRLEPDGRARAEAAATIINEAPVGAPAGYVFGPYEGLRVDGRTLEPGEDRTWTQFYCAAGCGLVRATEDGADTILESHRERGHAVYAGFIEVKPSQRRRVALSLTLPTAWEGDAASGSYRVRVQGQSTLATRANVTIRAPEGMAIAWTSVPMSVQGGVATWQGPLEGTRDFEVRFQRGFFGRVWA